MARRGFTLLELLIVITVLAVLSSMVFGLMHFVESGRIGVTEKRVLALGFEVKKQQGLKGAPPAHLEDLAVAAEQSAWMKNGRFVDSWDRPLEYQVTGRQFTLWSAGPDGVSGTEDDIRYPRNQGVIR